MEQSQAAINTDDNTANPTDISTGVVSSAVAQKNFPLNKGTLEAINGIEQTEMLFERFLTLQKLRIGCGSAERIPPASEEYLVANKYFMNIRSKKKRVSVPTSAECKTSSVGLALWIVWDTTDPRTQWSPASLVTTTTTDFMVTTSIASDHIHKKRRQSGKVTKSSANTNAIADLPIASSDAANAASLIQPSSRIQIRSTKKVEASSAVKRIVSHCKNKFRST